MITTDIAELQALPEAQPAGLDELTEAGLLELRFYLPLHLWSYLLYHRRSVLIIAATKLLRTVWTNSGSHRPAPFPVLLRTLARSVTGLSRPSTGSIEQYRRHHLSRLNGVASFLRSFGCPHLH